MAGFCYDAFVRRTPSGIFVLGLSEIPPMGGNLVFAVQRAEKLPAGMDFSAAHAGKLKRVHGRSTARNDRVR